jgi:single-stranded-DNA-specific exonuclease
MDNQWKVFWNLNAPYYKEKEQVAKNLKNVLGISDFLAKLLVSRNIESPEKADIFLNHPEEETYDPFLMNDMDKAINILMEAKRKKEKVAIFGDYDVDGVTSSSILYLGMKKLGFDVITYIPSRIEEGYSLNEKAISELKNKGYNILVTVDCGTTSIKEIEHAKSLGMKVIVTDHHLPKDTLPKSDAILNPKREDNKYPFKDLAGVGVAFKLLQALFMTNDKSLNPFEYIDLVAIGTIADIVSILSENRYFVKKG